MRHDDPTTARRPLPTPGEMIDSLAFSADDRTLYMSSAHVPLQRCTRLA
ncbi:hypothetical protein [Actinacidiphila oryziradicis]